MKKIIDVVRETPGMERIVARYNKDIETQLDTQGMDKEIPEVGDTLTDGNQEMTILEHVIIDGTVGVKFDNYPSIVPAEQVVQMIKSKIVKIK